MPSEYQPLIDASHPLALRLAPAELEPQPLYILDALELAGLPCGGCVFGFVFDDAFMDRNVIDRLGDRYTGPGHVMVLDFQAIALAANNFERAVQNTVVHEVAHLAGQLPPMEPGDTPKTRSLQLERMERSWAAPEPEAGSASDCHDWKFIRRVCHLWYRAKMAGIDVCPVHLFGPYYWMSSVQNYLCTILAECVTMADKPFAEIERAPTTRDFTELWEADLAYHRKRNEEKQCQS